MLFRSALLLLSAALATVASAEKFSFVSWNTTTINSTNTSVSGTIQTTTGPVGVTLTSTGAFDNVYQDDIYQPAASFTGGIVGNAPTANDGTNTDYLVQISQPATFTLAFSKPVTNLAYDLWSVGDGGTTVYYDFSASNPFSVVAGGGSQRYGGSALVQNGTTVSGNEGNGTLLFTNTYSTITWTVRNGEYYQGFTIGLSNVQVVPEPAPLAALGVGALALLRRRRRV